MTEQAATAAEGPVVGERDWSKWVLSGLRFTDTETGVLVRVERKDVFDPYPEAEEAAVAAELRRHISKYGMTVEETEQAIRERHLSWSFARAHNVELRNFFLSAERR